MIPLAIIQMTILILTCLWLWTLTFVFKQTRPLIICEWKPASSTKTQFFKKKSILATTIWWERSKVLDKFLSNAYLLPTYKTLLSKMGIKAWNSYLSTSEKCFKSSDLVFLKNNGWVLVKKNHQKFDKFLEKLCPEAQALRHYWIHPISYTR